MRPAAQTGVPITAPGLTPDRQPRHPGCRAGDRGLPVEDGRNPNVVGQVVAGPESVEAGQGTRGRPQGHPAGDDPTDHTGLETEELETEPQILPQLLLDVLGRRRHQPMDRGNVARRRSSRAPRLERVVSGRARSQARSCPRGIAGLRVLVGRRSSSVAALRTIELATIDNKFPWTRADDNSVDEFYPAKPTKGRKSPTRSHAAGADQVAPVVHARNLYVRTRVGRVDDLPSTDVQRNMVNR